MARAYTSKQLAPFLMTAINKAVLYGLADATIAPLTTVAGLRAAVEALTVKGSKKPELRRISTTLRVCGDMGLLTGTNIAAANNAAGLRAIATTANSSVSTKHFGPHLES